MSFHRKPAGAPRFAASAALAALDPVAKHFDLPLSAQAVGQSLGWFPDTPVTQDQLRLAAKALGLKSRRAVLDLRRPNALARSTPCILADPDGRLACLLAARPGQALLWQPGAAGGASGAHWVDLSELDGFGSELIVFVQPLRLDATPGRFGISWFLPALWRYRRPLGQVLLGAFLVQLVAVAMPLFSQVIIDKVLMHRSLSTLHVLGLGMLGLIAFEAVARVLRGYMLTHTAARLDAGLGSELFHRVLSLPLRYFEQRQAGDTLARMRELESVRSFFTGSALTTLLDGLFIFVFIGVMLLYSTHLTWVALAGLPVLVAVTLLAEPALQRALKARFDRSAEVGSFLVESVHGIQTVKSLALAPIWQRRWDLLLARQVSAGFDLAQVGTAAQSLSQAVQRCMTLAVLWMGTTLVMDNQLTIGGLIAFQMLAGQVQQPTSRLAALWQQFAQVKLSVDRLGDLMNAPVEPGASPTQPRLALQGRIEFKGVHFRYDAQSSPVLHDLHLSLAPGDIVGIVGRSGCGKSTLTKLVQRLYSPDAGRLLLDGQDIAQADPLWLRGQIGVVLQDSFLFNGTVAQNIAIAHPDAPMERIARVAQLAGAHDFVSALPLGYHSPVGEQGRLLSGGQRQRIAIARALMGNPRILILDEATSALDIESERAIQANMALICRGRTVILIAHRLSTLRGVHRIAVLDAGRVVEEGPPAELLARNGPFAQLWALQNGSPARRAEKVTADESTG